MHFASTICNMYEFFPKFEWFIHLTKCYINVNLSMQFQDIESSVKKYKA